MPKGQKFGGSDFKKGRPKTGGNKKLTEEQLEIKRTLERMNGKLLLAKHCIKDYSELKQFVKRKDVPVIELVIARVVERAIAKAEINYLNWIYERLGWDYDEENRDNTRTITLNYKI